MNKLLLSVFVAVPFAVACSESASHAAPITGETKNVQTLDVGCAGCVFQMPGAEGCQLAVKIGDKIHLVSGVDMPGHESGLCDHSRTARIAGVLEGDRFAATSMELQP